MADRRREGVFCCSGSREPVISCARFRLPHSMNISKRFFQIADQTLAAIDGKARQTFQGYAPWPQKSKDLYGTYYYKEARQTEVGFFLGYLLLDKDRSYPNVLPPECFFFIFIHPISRPLHRKLVRMEEGLFERWLLLLGERRSGVAEFHLTRNKLAALFTKHSLHAVPTLEMSLTSRRFFHDSLRQVNALGIPPQLADTLDGPPVR